MRIGISKLKTLFNCFAICLCAVDLYLLNYKIFIFSKDQGLVNFVLIGDPQMEGSSKLENNWLIGTYDLLFNDNYMKVIYNNALDIIKPKILITMGDILSSEWIDDQEFLTRVGRFNRISGHGSRTSQLGQSTHFHNISGNHDIGYGYKTDSGLVTRWENSFGSLNFDFKVDSNGEKVFDLNHQIEASNHHFIFLNAMNLDPSQYKENRNITWNFLRDLVKARRQYSIETPIPAILFTHIPLHKPSGFCVDGPEIIYTEDGYVESQNFLSEITSMYLLQCIKPTIIFNGHDHEGCKYLHQTSLEINTTGDAFERLVQGYNGTDGGNSIINSSRLADDVGRRELALEIFCGSSADMIDMHGDDWLMILPKPTTSSRPTTEPIKEPESEPEPKPKVKPVNQRAQFCSSFSDKCFATQEITVRSIMGDYSGASGVFSFSILNPRSGTDSSAFASSADSTSGSVLKYNTKKQRSYLPSLLQTPGVYSSVSFESGTFFYKYCELRFIHHALARIVLFANIFICLGFVILNFSKVLVAVTRTYKKLGHLTRKSNKQL